MSVPTTAKLVLLIEERIQDPAAVQGDGPGGQTENYRQTLFSGSVFRKIGRLRTVPLGVPSFTIMKS